MADQPLDYEQCTPDEREVMLDRVLTQRNVLLDEALRVILAADALDDYRADGSLSMADWLAYRCRVSRTTARQWVRAATRAGGPAPDPGPVRGRRPELRAGRARPHLRPAGRRRAPRRVAPRPELREIESWPSSGAGHIGPTTTKPAASPTSASGPIFRHRPARVGLPGQRRRRHRGGRPRSPRRGRRPRSRDRRLGTPRTASPWPSATCAPKTSGAPPPKGQSPTRRWSSSTRRPSSSTTTPSSERHHQRRAHPGGRASPGPLRHPRGDPLRHARRSHGGRRPSHSQPARLAPPPGDRARPPPMSMARLRPGDPPPPPHAALDQRRSTDAANLMGVCWHHHHLLHEGGWNATGNADLEILVTSPYGRTLQSRAGPMAA